MSDVIRSALVRSFGLFGELLESYTGKLAECKNEKVLGDVINLMGREYKGKKSPSMYEIKDRYFKVFKSDTKTNSCFGVYSYDIGLLVRNDSPVVPSNGMVKVCIVNPEACKQLLWGDDEADKYSWDCLHAWEEANGFIKKASPKEKMIMEVLSNWKESAKRFYIAAKRPPIQYPKDWNEKADIYENEAIPF